MSRILRVAMASACAFACIASTHAVAQTQSNNAPPGNVSPKDTNAGKNAGYAGGAGAGGQYGTDPKTLKKTEENRVRKNGGSDNGKRKDWKE